MNERILELAEKVDKWFKEDGHSYSRPAWNEKFAELIVRECAGIAAKVGEGYVQMGYVVPLECSMKIKEHFGVKE